MKYYGIVETDDIIIGKANDVISYLKRIENEIKANKQLDNEEKDLQEIRKLILKLKYEFITNEIVYLKRNWNKDITVNILDTDIL